MKPDDVLTLTRELLGMARLDVPVDELLSVAAGVAAARATAELLDPAPVLIPSVDE